MAQVFGGHGPGGQRAQAKVCERLRAHVAGVCLVCVLCVSCLEASLYIVCVGVGVGVGVCICACVCV
jgi:hypothetical protein